MHELTIPPLNGTKAATYACSCAERLLPLYRAFQRETGWDSEEKLAALLNRAWDMCDQGDDSTGWIAEHLDAAERLVPHADDFDTCFITGAQNCGICVDLAIKNLADPRRSDIATISEYALDAVVSVELCKETGNLSAQDDPKLLRIEQRIRRGDYARRELFFQRRDLRELESSSRLAEDTVRNIRTRSRDRT
jgi:uncharacterized protein YjaG (DUF416 family)